MAKEKTSAQLKKDLDTIFSRYIRLKHSHNEMCTCYTCGKVLHWKEIQNGHFIPRNILITRWDENNCRPQCVGCNVFGNGKILDFEDALIKEFGKKEVEKLKASRFQILKVDSHWYKEKIDFYTQEVYLLSTDCST